MNKYHCAWCNSIVTPVRLGRANYVCPKKKCWKNMTLEMVFLDETRPETHHEECCRCGVTKKEAKNQKWKCSVYWTVYTQHIFYY